MVKYDYDAWGAHRVLNSAGSVITDTQHVGNVNPFRYRGYYYDTETGLYYLKSRYYDPETCRFINMDSVEYADPTYLHGLNLYAYCNNNPIMYVDPNGNSFFAFLIAGLIVGAVVGFGATVYSDYKDDGVVFNGSVSAGAYVGNTLVGGAIGGIIGGTIGALPTIASGMGSAFAPTVSGGAIAITGEQALLGSLGLIALGNIVFSNLPNQGDPNSTIIRGGTTGVYDSNGNLISRRDTTGKPHFIKEFGEYFLPHTHIYNWEKINGIWRIISKYVLPF